MVHMPIWTGDSKLVVGIDIGTTYSGVTYALLKKGQAPEIRRVSDWPGQKRNQGLCRIPTLVWYGNSKPLEFGAEVKPNRVYQYEKTGSQHLARHFKLMLHPDDMVIDNLDNEPIPQPEGIPAEQIYRDFFNYVLTHTKTTYNRYKREEQPWGDLPIDIVLTYPNGWHERQKDKLAAAIKETPEIQAINASFSFLHEAEASAHFCIYHHMGSGLDLQANDTLIICDAGGSTVDIARYEVTRVEPKLELHETDPSGCIQAGGIYIDAEFKKYVTTELSKSHALATRQKLLVQELVDSFREEIRMNFDAIDFPYELKVESLGINDNFPEAGIIEGKLMISRDLVKQCFDVVLNHVKRGLKDQMLYDKPKYILLVGGLSDNPYIQNQLEDLYGDVKKTRVIACNDPMSKSVSDGAILWKAAFPTVLTRSTRFAWGKASDVPYTSTKREHLKRIPREKPDGKLYLGNGWTQIIPKDKQIGHEDYVWLEYHKYYDTPNPDLGEFTDTLFSYNSSKIPKFMSNPNGTIPKEFRKQSLIRADLQHLAGALHERLRPDGNHFWELCFKVGIVFGGTKVTARIEWQEKGEKQYKQVQLLTEGF